MKRFLCLFLCLLTLLSMAGCDSSDPGSVSFFYCRNPQEYQYFEENGVIDSEERSLSGHRYDLQYMLGLYLAGPLDEKLISPFAKTTRLLSAAQTDASISIVLSDHTRALSDSEFALACACLALTCMDFTSCTEVTVTDGNRAITMHADNMLLYDTLPQQETTGG